MRRASAQALNRHCESRWGESTNLKAARHCSTRPKPRTPSSSGRWLWNSSAPTYSKTKNIKPVSFVKPKRRASLIHSNICVIHEIDESEGAPFIAMELVEGETVKQRSRPGRPSWTKRLTLPFKLQLDCKRRTKKELFTVTSRART